VARELQGFRRRRTTVTPWPAGRTTACASDAAEASSILGIPGEVEVGEEVPLVVVLGLASYTATGNPFTVTRYSPRTAPPPERGMVTFFAFREQGFALI
jgi:hypothetical protein